MPGLLYFLSLLSSGKGGMTDSPKRRRIWKQHMRERLRGFVQLIFQHPELLGIHRMFISFSLVIIDNAVLLFLKYI
jgi:hypothetical protein